MTRKLLTIFIVSGALVLSLTAVQVSRSQSTTPDRVMAYVVNKDIHLYSSNTRGDRQATDVGDVYTIFDERPDGSVLYGRQNGPELQHTDTTFKTSLWLLRPNRGARE